jgi:2,4-dienoyl-CoA reductase-like NADH-dependent reductase (Old Yellow Enzyme family)
VSVPVFAVGGIRFSAEVDEVLERGEADMAGIGRPFYAEHDLARRILDRDDGSTRCQSSNLCVPPQMLGMKGVCYNPAVKSR